MNVVVNGERRDVSSGATVQTLLDTLGLAAQATVVQRNDEIVNRSSFADTALADGDTLELVRFVGGG